MRKFPKLKSKEKEEAEPGMLGFRSSGCSHGADRTEESALDGALCFQTSSGQCAANDFVLGESHTWLFCSLCLSLCLSRVCCDLKALCAWHHTDIMLHRRRSWTKSMWHVLLYTRHAMGVVKGCVLCAEGIHVCAACAVPLVCCMCWQCVHRKNMCALHVQHPWCVTRARYVWGDHMCMRRVPCPWCAACAGRV